MQLEDILESNYLYCQQNISIPSVICNAASLYPETDSMWEIFCVYVSDNPKRYFDQTNHIV
jgi:hypothetical protein